MSRAMIWMAFELLVLGILSYEPSKCEEKSH